MTFYLLAYYLPKDDEYYQFCYVDQDGIVRGASVPFQFRVASEDDMLVVTTQVCLLSCSLICISPFSGVLPMCPVSLATMCIRH